MFFCTGSAAQDQASSATAWSTPVNEFDLYVKVRLDAPLKVSRLTPGEEVSGTLLQDVYSGSTQIFPASSMVHLTVDRLERRPRGPNDHWPRVIKAFMRRHEMYPVFRSATVISPDGRQTCVPVSVVSVSKEVEVESTRKRDAHPDASPITARKSRRELGPILTLAASSTKTSPGNERFTAQSLSLVPGMEAKVILLRDVSASKDHAGASFQARLIEPVKVDSKIVLPEGSVLAGKVVKSRAPRTLSRSGSIYLAFTDVTVPGGASSPIAASIAGAEIDRNSHTIIDPEGQMHGDRPGKAWMIMNVGVTAGIAKGADDGAQLLIEALVSSATDVSTAGTAKIVSSCASAIFLLTRHGRDVVLPKYTQMKIVFDRPAQIAERPLRSSPGY